MAQKCSCSDNAVSFLVLAYPGSPGQRAVKRVCVYVSDFLFSLFLSRYNTAATWVSLSRTLLLQPFNGLFSRTTWVRRYQKGKTNLDFTGARDSEWQWYQLGHMQVCTSLQTDNHSSTPPLCFLQAGCTSCRPINSVKALKALCLVHHGSEMFLQ